nr:hypothetical protein [Tanacetum cinerariifolium]
MRARVFLRSRRVFNPKGLIKRAKMLDRGSDVLKGGIRVEVVIGYNGCGICLVVIEFLLYLVFSNGWLGLRTQPTSREVDRNEVLMVNLVRVEKVKALGANGDMSGSIVGVVWMEVRGGTVRARVVSRVVLRLVVMGSRD